MSAEGDSEAAISSISEQGDDEHLDQLLQVQSPLSTCTVKDLSSSYAFLGGANVWQLRPDTIFWDSKIRNLAPDSNISNEKTRLLMLFLDVIHPLSHTFYKLDSNDDRSWMLNRLVSSKGLYNSALSISACFDYSLSQPPCIDNIGICPKVRSLQSSAVRELQIEIDRFVLMDTTPLEELVWTGIQLLDVVVHLKTLEIFSMLQGYWEMHHRASRKILNHLEICVSSHVHDGREPKASLVEAALSSWPLGDERRRSLEFCIANFVWIDVLAMSTFGSMSYEPCAFDYLDLLRSEIIKPQKLMGCQGWIMAQVVEIANLERRKILHQDLAFQSTSTTEILRCDKQIAAELEAGIWELERGYGQPNSTTWEDDSRLISILWAYGAQIFRQTITSDLESPQTNIDQNFVNTCLEKLEELPTRLVMRATWPYTIAGCMSTSESNHARFRQVLARTMLEAQPPGVSWKGLIVMEECWKLRQTGGIGTVGWRDAMKSLGARIILT